MSTTQSTTPPPQTPDQPESAERAPAGGPPAEAMLELQAFLTGLLRRQCELVGGAAGLAILAPGSSRRGGVVARFQSQRAEAASSQGSGSVLTAALVARAERMAEEMCADPTSEGATRVRVEQAPGARNAAMYGEGPRTRLFAAPLLTEGRVEGACVVVRVGEGTVGDDALMALALSAAQFEAFLWRRQCLAESEQKMMLRETVELLDASQRGESAGAFGAILCQELKRRFGCARVCVGLMRRDLVRIVAVSDADEVERTAPAIESLEAAMEEAAAQDAEIVYPAPGVLEGDPALRRVTRAHDELSRRFGPSSILSLPLRVEGGLVGVIVLERPIEDPFPLGSLALLRLTSEVVGPGLWNRRLADRGILAVTRDRTLDLAAALVGPRHTGPKALGLLVGGLVVGSAILPVPDRVTAPAEVRATVARIVAPPFVGYLKSTLVQPGDAVTEGQVLALMDTTELDTRLAEAGASVESLKTQRDDALARSELSKVRVLEAQMQEKEASVRLLTDQIARAEIRAPVAGLVGKGELDQAIGARVEPSQALFEIVGTRHEAVVSAGERAIRRVRDGQQGKLVVRARPGVEIPVRVTRINPSAEVLRGANVYTVVVEVIEEPDPNFLRPGLTGTVKLDDGFTTPLADFLDPIIDEARLRLWW